MDTHALGVAQHDQDKAAARDALDAAAPWHADHDPWLAGAQWAINHVHRLCHEPRTPLQRGDAVHMRLVTLQELLDDLNA